MNFTRDTDDETFEHALRTGISITNDAFGLAIPEDGEGFATARIGARSSDELYQDLIYAACSTPNTERGPLAYANLNPTFIPDPLDLGSINSGVALLSELEEHALLDEVDRSFVIDPIDLITTFTDQNYIWAKINHAWWELVTSYAFEEKGIPSGRFRNPTFFELSRTFEIVRRTLEKFPSTRVGETVNYATSGSALAISFNNGTMWHADYMGGARAGEWPFDAEPARQAMLGCVPFVTRVAGSKRILVADGAGAKRLAYDNRLTEFCEVVRGGSDVVIFVVPEHLAKIELSGWRGETVTVVVPSSRIHELWPPTLAVVAGAIDQLLRTASRITVLVQAAVVSAPIACLVAHLASGYAGRVRLYDLGQLLDLAEPAGERTMTWVCKFEQSSPGAVISPPDTFHLRHEDG